MRGLRIRRSTRSPASACRPGEPRVERRYTATARISAGHPLAGLSATITPCRSCGVAFELPQLGADPTPDRTGVLWPAALDMRKQIASLSYYEQKPHGCGRGTEEIARILRKGHTT